MFVCVCVAQMANNARVLGIVLMHATGTTAGLFDMMKDKVCIQSQSVSYLPSLSLSTTRRNARNTSVVAVRDICTSLLCVWAACR